MSDSTFSLYAAGLGLMLGLGTVTVVDAAADNGCPDPPCSIARSEDASTLEEIVVTGTHIRGAEAAGSKLIVIGRDQIDASGYGRVEDVLATVTRLVGNLSWSLRGWTVQSTVNYTCAYRDPASAPVRRVDSWTTVDVNIGYRVDGGSGWLANTQSNLGINNALDQRPPLRQPVCPDFGHPGVRPGQCQSAGQASQPAGCEAMGAVS